MAYAEVFSDGAALVEVNAETDFVAQNDQFKEFTKDVCYVVAKWGPVDMETLMTLPYRKTGLTVQQMLQEKVLVIGENIKIRRFARFDSGMRRGLQPYERPHRRAAEHGSVRRPGDQREGHRAGQGPGHADRRYEPCLPGQVRREPGDPGQGEEEIQLATLANDPKMAAKPDKVKEGIVMGKLGKFYEENCLMQQAFVKENKVSVEKHVAAVAKEVGGSIQIKAFYRFEKGEGLEKKEEELRRRDRQAVGSGLIGSPPSKT